ncbi:MAG TPA: FG-GAP-like repeat-containing protein [Polyangiaceae bacterium]|nr:FG-GAP-like repeat-containing protein [Polyangiaceae bacterium]
MPNNHSRELFAIILLPMLAGACSAAPADEALAAQGQAIIVGPDNLQYVNIYDGTRGVSKSFVTAHKGPVAAISHESDENIATCTGTLIGTNVFITAAHCFEGYGYVPEQWTAYFNYEYTAGEGSPWTTLQQFAVDKVLDHLDNYNALEFAILRLKGDPGATFDWTDLRATTATSGEVAAIIGHPASRPKQVDAGHLNHPATDTIGYDVDTLARSSGSGVLDSSGKLIAVHTTGHDVEGYNHGVRVSSILGVSSVLAGVESGSSFSEDLDFCTQAGTLLFAGDFNGDNRDDLLCKSATSMSVAYANDSGQFTGAGWTAASTYCTQSGAKLYVGDFNGDHRDDLLCRDPSGATSISSANASGQLPSPSWSATLAWCNQAGAGLWVGDLNGDGRDDLLCHDSTGYTSTVLASSSGQFSASNAWSKTLNFCKQAGGQLVLADLNKDKRKDMVCHDATGFTASLQANSSGQYTGSVWSSTINWCKLSGSAVYAGDYNGDGRDDLLCRDPASILSVSLANSSGRFTGTSSLGTSAWCAGAMSVVGGYFNTDLRADLACRQSSGVLQITNPRKDGTF